MVQLLQRLGLQVMLDERRVAGTTRADDEADGSRRRDITSATG